MELRCGSRILHGIVNEDNTVEVTCKSKWCGKKPGVVVLHKFDLDSGECVSTTRLSEPEEGDGSRQQGITVRHASDSTDAVGR